MTKAQYNELLGLLDKVIRAAQDYGGLLDRYPEEYFEPSALNTQKAEFLKRLNEVTQHEEENG